MRSFKMPYYNIYFLLLDHEFLLRTVYNISFTRILSIKTISNSCSHNDELNPVRAFLRGIERHSNIPYVINWVFAQRVAE